MANQIHQLAEKLEDLGLSEKEARVYVAALFLGPSSVQKIAEQAGVNRPTAYVILDKLEEYGLVSESTEGKKTVFVAEEPEALNRWLDQQEKKIEEKRGELKNILPDLEDVTREEVAEAPVVRFYRGKEGVDSISAYLRRKARQGSEIYAMTNEDEVLKVFPEILESKSKNRIKKKLSSKLLYSYSKGEIPSDDRTLRKTKKLQGDVKADISLFEDKAALVAYSDDPNKLTGILIESPEIVGALRQLFEMAWENTDNKK